MVSIAPNTPKIQITSKGHLCRKCYKALNKTFANK